MVHCLAIAFVKLQFTNDAYTNFKLTSEDYLSTLIQNPIDKAEADIQTIIYKFQIHTCIN